MNIKLGIVMDPIAIINPQKDSSFAMLLEAQKRGWEIHYIEQSDIFVSDGVVFANAQSLTVDDNKTNWFELQNRCQIALSQLDVILMRLEPPFNINYIYTTYQLELAEQQGCLVVNKPQSLRDVNEKFSLTAYPELTPKTFVSSDRERLKDFLSAQKEAVFKPLDGMGGASIFRLTVDDVNTSVVLDTLTEFGKTLIMAQAFIPEIVAGDKRILLIDGEPVPYALARIPKQGEFRGNLAAGGRGEVVPLTDNDYKICQALSADLQQKGLVFVGIDVIGDYLTEINVTCPTCIRQIDAQCGLNISAMFLDWIEERLSCR